MNKGKFGFIIYFVLLNSISASSQTNLVLNPSFEDYTACPNGCEGVVDLATYWHPGTSTSSDYLNRDDVHTCKISCVTGNLSAFEILVAQPPKQGRAVMGIICYSEDNYREYIQGQLSTSLISGQVYKIGFYVKRFNHANHAMDEIGILLSQTTSFSSSTAATVKSPTGFVIKSKNEWTLIYGLYTASGSESYVTIGYFGSSAPSNHPHINTGCYNEIDGAYYLIDDVFVELVDDPDLIYCNSECNPTAGTQNPFTSIGHDTHNPFRFENLDNLTQITIDIYDAGNNWINTLVANCLNGIRHSVYWNGKTYSGVEVDAGTYHYKIYATNDCGTVEFNDSFVKNNTADDGTDTPPDCTPCCETDNIKLPTKCCLTMSDFHLYNVSIYGPENLTWQIPDNLYVANYPGFNVTCSSHSDVIFKAGNSIAIGSGFSTSGDRFEATIEPCPSLRLGNIENQELKAPGKNAISKRSEEIMEKQLSIITLNPNPSKGAFKFQIDGKDIGEYEIRVYNILSEMIYSSRMNISSSANIDLSNQSPGVYFLKAQSGASCFTQKLVIE